MTRIRAVFGWVIAYVIASLLGSVVVFVLWVVPDGLRLDDLARHLILLLVIAGYVATLALPFAFIFSAIPEMRGAHPRPAFYGFVGAVAGFVGMWIMQYSLILPDGFLATIISRAPFMIAGAVAGLVFGAIRRISLSNH